MDWLGIVCLLLCFVLLVAANLSFVFFLSFHKCMSMHCSFGFPFVSPMPRPVVLYLDRSRSWGTHSSLATDLIRISGWLFVLCPFWSSLQSLALHFPLLRFPNHSLPVHLLPMHGEMAPFFCLSLSIWETSSSSALLLPPMHQGVAHPHMFRSVSILLVSARSPSVSVFATLPTPFPTVCF